MSPAFNRCKASPGGHDDPAPKAERAIARDRRAIPIGLSISLDQNGDQPTLGRWGHGMHKSDLVHRHVRIADEVDPAEHGAAMAVRLQGGHSRIVHLNPAGRVVLKIINFHLRLSQFANCRPTPQQFEYGRFTRYLSLFHHGNRRERMNLAFGDGVPRCRCVFFCDLRIFCSDRISGEH
jgi:hypothetical protein